MPNQTGGSGDEPIAKLGGKPYRLLVAAHVAKTFAGTDLVVYEDPTQAFVYRPAQLPLSAAKKLR
jgi:hypothetical protein